MYEGIVEIASRVAQLQSALDAPAPHAPASKKASDSSFQQALKQTQQQQLPAASPTHRFSVGVNGATQLPGGGTAAPMAPAAAAGGFGLLGLGDTSGMGSTS